MKLMSMTDFVLQENFKTHSRFFPETAIKYAEFLKQPLTLGMFVPVDDDGNVLEEPEKKIHDFWNSACVDEEYEIQYQIFEEAKEKVLFEGVKIKHRENYFILEDEDGTWIRVRKNKKKLKIEDLLKMSSVELTPYALKQILP